MAEDVSGRFQSIELVDEFDAPTGDTRAFWHSDKRRHIARLTCYSPWFARQSQVMIEAFFTDEFVAAGAGDGSEVLHPYVFQYRYDSVQCGNTFIPG